MKFKKVLVAALVFIPVFATAQDLPLGGEDYITHDYTCVGSSTGRSAVMTVQEMPGGANSVTVAENSSKPIAVNLIAMDDQTRASRQYKLNFGNGAEEVLQLSSLTKMATVTMLHAVGLEVFTSLVCYEEK